MSGDKGRAILLMLALRHRKARQAVKHLPLNAPAWLGTMHSATLMEAKFAHQAARRIYA